MLGTQISPTTIASNSRRLCQRFRMPMAVCWWGVSERNPRATATLPTEPFPSLTKDFAERLRSSLLNTTMPHNHSIEIKTVADDQSTGFVLCLIGPSDNAPIRAMVGDREYYVRMGNGTARRTLSDPRHDDAPCPARLGASHLAIESARCRRPSWDPIRSYQRWTGHGRNRAPSVGTARAIVEIFGARIASADGFADMSHLNPGQNIAIYSGNASLVIHPVDIAIQFGSLIIDQIGESRAIEIDARWYCEGQSENG